MGRRWWQKEARARANSALLASPDVDSNSVDENSVKQEENIEGAQHAEVLSNDLAEAASDLSSSIDQIEDSDIDVQSDNVEEEDDAKDVGITITTKNSLQNNKKKRRR